MWHSLGHVPLNDTLPPPNLNPALSLIALTRIQFHQEATTVTVTVKVLTPHLRMALTTLPMVIPEGQKGQTSNQRCCPKHSHVQWRPRLGVQGEVE